MILSSYAEFHGGRAEFHGEKQRKKLFSAHLCGSLCISAFLIFCVPDFLEFLWLK
jgi:hypothetical protein